MLNLKRSSIWLIGLLILAGGRATAAMPPLLDAAVAKLQADEDHWAYTRTMQEFDRAGLPKGGPTVERFDPSQPYAAQWSLAQWKGHAPSAGEQRAWARRKEREIKRREEKTLGEVMDFAQARAIEERGPNTVFEIPLLPGASKRWPAEKFVVHAVVDRARAILQGFTLQNRTPFRTMGVARVDTIEIQARFRLIDERYAPQPDFARAQGAGRILFFPVGAAAELTWTDYRRVTPYNDRFEVKIGDLKAFGF
ncbi:MAG: hypothetical protein ACHQ4G_08255 [Opitutales bacterium]